MSDDEGAPVSEFEVVDGEPAPVDYGLEDVIIETFVPGGKCKDVERPHDKDTVDFPVSVIFNFAIDEPVVAWIDKTFASSEARELARCMLFRWIYLIPYTGSTKSPAGKQVKGDTGIFLWDPLLGKHEITGTDIGVLLTFVEYTEALCERGDNVDNFVSLLTRNMANAPQMVVIVGHTELENQLYGERFNIMESIYSIVNSGKHLGKPLRVLFPGGARKKKKATRIDERLWKVDTHAGAKNYLSQCKNARGTACLAALFQPGKGQQKIVRGNWIYKGTDQFYTRTKALVDSIMKSADKQAAFTERVEKFHRVNKDMCKELTTKRALKNASTIVEFQKQWIIPFKRELSNEQKEALENADTDGSPVLKALLMKDGEKNAAGYMYEHYPSQEEAVDLAQTLFAKVGSLDQKQVLKNVKFYYGKANPDGSDKSEDAEDNDERSEKEKNEGFVAFGIEWRKLSGQPRSIIGFLNQWISEEPSEKHKRELQMTDTADRPVLRALLIRKDGKKSGFMYEHYPSRLEGIDLAHALFPTLGQLSLEDLLEDLRLFYGQEEGDDRGGFAAFVNEWKRLSKIEPAKPPPPPSKKKTKNMGEMLKRQRDDEADSPVPKVDRPIASKKRQQVAMVKKPVGPKPGEKLQPKPLPGSKIAAQPGRKRVPQVQRDTFVQKDLTAQRDSPVLDFDSPEPTKFTVPPQTRDFGQQRVPDDIIIEDLAPEPVNKRVRATRGAEPVDTPRFEILRREVINGRIITTFSNGKKQYFISCKCDDEGVNLDVTDATLARLTAGLTLLPFYGRIGNMRRFNVGVCTDCFYDS